MFDLATFDLGTFDFGLETAPAEQIIFQGGGGDPPKRKKKGKRKPLSLIEREITTTAPDGSTQKVPLREHQQRLRKGEEQPAPAEPDAVPPPPTPVPHLDLPLPSVQQDEGAPLEAAQRAANEALERAGAELRGQAELEARMAAEREARISASLDARDLRDAMAVLMQIPDPVSDQVTRLLEEYRDMQDITRVLAEID